MSTADSRSEELIRLARDGDAAAAEALLEEQRSRLRRMVSVRMDPRLSRRIDPSDVVQDALAVAIRKLPQYLREAPLPFYPWLRQIAWNRLVDLHRRHIRASNRTVGREHHPRFPCDDRSVRLLAERFGSLSSSPSVQIIRNEAIQRVQTAMHHLPEPMREVLVLRHLEELSVQETATAMGVSEGTVKSRHFRALARLRELLEDNEERSHH